MFYSEILKYEKKKKSRRTKMQYKLTNISNR